MCPTNVILAASLRAHACTGECMPTRWELYPPSLFIKLYPPSLFIELYPSSLFIELYPPSLFIELYPPSLFIQLYPPRLGCWTGRCTPPKASQRCVAPSISATHPMAQQPLGRCVRMIAHAHTHGTGDDEHGCGSFCWDARAAPCAVPTGRNPQGVYRAWVRE